MNSVRAASRLVIRSMTTEAAPAKGFIPKSEGYESMTKLQRALTTNDGTFVWTKFISDKLTYKVSCVLSVVGLATVAATFRTMFYPRKVE